MTHSTNVQLPWPVAVDVAPVRAEPAGVGQYASRLVQALSQEFPAGIALIGVRPDAHLASEAHMQIPFKSASYHTWIQLHADADARATGARLVHYTNAAAPLVSRLPYVVTVHDFSLVRMPGSHPFARRLIVPIHLNALARAQVVIVPSRWTARELELLGVDRKRVVVIPHAPTLDSVSTDATDILRRLGLDDAAYILFVGTLEPRKNLIRLVAAFERISRDHADLRLVLAGAQGWHYSQLDRRIQGSPVRDRIVTPGYLPAPAIAKLIVSSGVVAYVSLYEGFGMPVLDSIALGAAVVTSRRTAMPDTARGAAVLVDPSSVGDIARGMRTALERRKELRVLALERGKGRSWLDVALEHADVYRFALSR